MVAQAPAGGAPMAPVAMPSLFTTALMVVDVVFPVLATLAVLLRFYARKGGRNYIVFADDWMILATLFFCWANTANTIVGAAEAGIDTSKIMPPKSIIVTVRTLWVEGFLLATALTLVKLSILHFYYRIFVTGSKSASWYKWSVIGMYGIIVSWWFSSFMCQLLVADPIRGAYNPVIQWKYRFDYNLWSVIFAGMSLFFDIIILLFPLPMIGGLRMDFGRKMSVIGIFWLGFFCCIAAAVRFYFLFTDTYRKPANPDPTANPYLKVTEGFIWAHIEPNASIIAACLPTYGIFFRTGRTAHSFIRSIRSRFGSIAGSRGDSGLSKSGRSTGKVSGDGTSSTKSLTDATGAGYYELNDHTEFAGPKGKKKTGTRVTVSASGDLEAQRDFGHGDIGVTREFRTERSPY